MQEVDHPKVAQSNTVKQFDCYSRVNSECKFMLFLVQISVQMHSITSWRVFVPFDVKRGNASIGAFLVGREG